MKLKKYEATTENLAIKKARDELGSDTVIVNIKKIKPNGISSLFKKPYVEVTAVYDEKSVEKIKSEEEKKELIHINTEDFLAEVKAQAKLQAKKNKSEDTQQRVNLNRDDSEDSLLREEFSEKRREKTKESSPTIDKNEKDEKIKELEKKLQETETCLANVVSELSEIKPYKVQKYSDRRLYKSDIIQFFYDSLLEQGIIPEVIRNMLVEVENTEARSLDINLIIKIVYNNIVKIVGRPVTILPNADRDFSIKNDKARNIIFVGPTGVGKTTTIAKIASSFVINKNAKIGFITTDTYRIAAVEQLKTYADILNSDIEVVYEISELQNKIDRFKHLYDFIFFDTAGRSHKNTRHMDELVQFINKIDDAEIYLVVSIATKYEDLINIVETYSEICDFNLIFTKLDETSEFGSIINITYRTNKKISYVANGQNVPSDLEIFSPEKLAKDLLGSR